MHTLCGPPKSRPPPPHSAPSPPLLPLAPQLYGLWLELRPWGTAIAALRLDPPRRANNSMEEFDSEDFSTSEEDEDYVPSGE